MRFIPQYEPLIREKYVDSVKNQMKSGWVGPSASTEYFEELICAETEAKHCVATTSGTMAIYMAICALGIEKKQIAFPDYTFLAGANAAKSLGYAVKLVDIKEDTLCMNPDSLKITNRMGAVMFVNHNAYMGEDVWRIREMCDQAGVPMIEDSSQAFGVKGAGITGDVGIFSFSVPKIVTTGQGGAIITNRDDVYEKCLRLRDHGGGWRGQGVHNYLGLNLKFNDILASYGIAQIRVLEELLEKRGKIWDWYREDIEIVDYGERSTWMVIFRSRDASGLVAELLVNNIQAKQYYRPIHTNPPYSSRAAFPVANEVYKHLVYLPSSLGLSRPDVKKITKIVKEFENE